MKNNTNTKCIHCKSQNHIRKGFRKTQNRGKIQKFLCLEGKRYFTNDTGFYRMRNSEAKITPAIDLYFSNLSSRQVRSFFRRHPDHNASHITIWIGADDRLLRNRNKRGVDLIKTPAKLNHTEVKK